MDVGLKQVLSSQNWDMLLEKAEPSMGSILIRGMKVAIPLNQANEKIDSKGQKIYGIKENRIIALFNTLKNIRRATGVITYPYHSFLLS